MLEIDTRTDDLESALAQYAPFNTALTQLDQHKYRVISIDEHVKLRLKARRSAAINSRGNYTQSAFVQTHDASPLIVRDSPLVGDKTWVEQAVTAHQNARHFVTPHRDVYADYAAIAEEDLRKHPSQRRVIALPQHDQISVSPSHNRDIFFSLFGENALDYLAFSGTSDITIYPVSSQDMNRYSGTVITQTWFGALQDGSSVNGNRLTLFTDARVRGIRRRKAQ